MYPSEQYQLLYLKDVPYLLPIGQGIATFHRQLKLNTSSAQIYQHIVDLCADQGDIPATSLVEQLLQILSKEDKHTVSQEEIRKDLWEVLHYFQSYQVLLEDYPCPTMDIPVSQTYVIAGHLIRFHGDADCISKEFASFLWDGQDIPEEHYLDLYLWDETPIPTGVGRQLLKTNELQVLETPVSYHIQSNASLGIEEIRLQKHGNRGDFYLHRQVPSVGYDIFHGTRLLLSYLLQKHEKYLVHSASILYRDHAWLFSGPSGTGKSTHATLWKQQYDVAHLNGDLNLIGFQKESTKSVPYVYGIPWCGTSGIYTTKAVPLGGIILLHQAPDNYLQDKTMDEQQLSVLQRMISPAWTAELNEKNCAFAEKLTQQIPIWHLYCNMEPEAVDVIKRRIDQYYMQNDKDEL